MPLTARVAFAMMSVKISGKEGPGAEPPEAGVPEGPSEMPPIGPTPVLTDP